MQIDLQSASKAARISPSALAARLQEAGYDVARDANGRLVADAGDVADVVQQRIQPARHRVTPAEAMRHDEASCLRNVVSRQLGMNEFCDDSPVTLPPRRPAQSIRSYVGEHLNRTGRRSFDGRLDAGHQAVRHRAEEEAALDEVREQQRARRARKEEYRETLLDSIEWSPNR